MTVQNRGALAAGTVMVVVLIAAYVVLEIRQADTASLLAAVIPIVTAVLVVRSQGAVSSQIAASDAATAERVEESTRILAGLTVGLEAVQREQEAQAAGIGVIAKQTNGDLDERIRSAVAASLTEACRACRVTSTTATATKPTGVNA